MKDLPEWILASGSPRRRELLQRINPHFRVLSPDVEEWEPMEADPAEQVIENAARKAGAVATLHPGAFVIGADTTVALGRRLFAKPGSLDEARRMLRTLSGQSHQVFTGVALRFGDQRHTFHEVSEVAFKQLDDAAIEAYLDRVEVLDKAGAYAIQEASDLIIQRYWGSFENIMGLPTKRLVHEMLLTNWTSMS